MIHHATDDTIERIARSLLDRTLPYSEWTHGSHFAAALWLLRHPAVLASHGGIEVIIRGYNEAVGVTNSDSSGYHATITIASLRGAASFLEAGCSLAAAHTALMASPLGQSRWPLVYWSEARLMSVAARRAWVEPDIARLPYPPLVLSAAA